MKDFYKNSTATKLYNNAKLFIIYMTQYHIPKINIKKIILIVCGKFMEN